MFKLESETVPANEMNAQLICTVQPFWLMEQVRLAHPVTAHWPAMFEHDDEVLELEQPAWSIATPAITSNPGSLRA
jgi:hypothetical protein